MLWRETIQTHGLLNSLFVDRRAGEQARWLDLRKKAFPLTARSMDALLIEHDAVDIRLLREYVDKLPKDAFTQNAQRDNAFLDGRTKNQQAIKPGVDTMHLIFSDRSGEEIFLFPYWEKFRPYVTPLLTSLFTRQLGVEDPTKHIVRLQIAVMNAGAMIHTHVDSGPWATRNHRFHIPIVVPPEVDAAQLIISPPGMDEVAVTPVEGRPFEINNAVEHTVRNRASSWRIHLLVDFSENEIPNSNLHALPVGAEPQLELQRLLDTELATVRLVLATVSRWAPQCSGAHTLDQNARLASWALRVADGRSPRFVTPCHPHHPV